MIARYRNFDWALIGSLLVLATASLLALASSGGIFFKRQVMWYLLAFLVIFIGSQIDWRLLVSRQWFRSGLYFLSIALLLFVYLQPHTIRGTKSWIVLGGFQFEPEELAKISLLFVLAYFFSKRHVAAWQARNLFLSLAYTLIPTFLIIIQPNFGSAILVASIWVGFVLLSGIHTKRFLVGLLVLAVVGMLLWVFVFKDYQKDRITTFFIPEQDPLGASYNVIQSKIAIGSAGLWGKGFGRGTQARLGFLPASQNDFLFAAFVEEWGIVGAAVLIGAVLFLIYRLIRIGLRARDNFARLMALGGGVFFFVHFTINIGANVGLLPVTGITLPFFSYGGSNLLTTGVLLSIMEHIKLESSA